MRRRRNRTLVERVGRPARHERRDFLEKALVLTLGHVEAQKAAGSPGVAEDIARREHDRFLERLPCELRRVDAVRQPAPDEHARLRLDPGADADRPQPPGNVRHRARQTLSHRFHMPAIAAVRQKRQHQLRGKTGAAEAGGDLEVRQPVDPVARCGDETAARGRRQRF
ncbi:hypothetical protein ATB98_03155 [Sinorhizobium saheli]|uniref:Uncharacterized protein n=1 Tax=Sinorhizobium saheli TaxID=36856 RepID=A0A178YR79_SINSA|nr:hypothetical protein ATB98_03155 [Sinorhizobium saheli]